MKFYNEFLIKQENIANKITKFNIEADILSWHFSRKLALFRFLLLLLNLGFFIFSILLKLKIASLICILYFILDYSFHRYIHKQEYKKGLMIINKFLLEDKFYSVYETRQNNVVDKKVRDEYKSSSRKGFIKVGFQTNAYKELILKELFNSLDFKDKEVLDIGCGTGEILKLLVNSKTKRLAGFDLNPEFVEVVKKLGFEAFCGDILNLPFNKSAFDIIIFTEVIEHLHNPIGALEKIKEILKPGGLLIITTSNNRTVLTSFCLNPLIFLEKIIGNYYDKVLPLRRIISTDDYTYYHTTYSKIEIFNIINSAGFSRISLNTFGQFIFLSLILPLKFIIRFERLLAGIFPPLRYNGATFLILCRK